MGLHGGTTDEQATTGENAVAVLTHSQSPERRWDYLSLKVSAVELPSTREPSIGALGQSGGRWVARIVATIRELE